MSSNLESVYLPLACFGSDFVEIWAAEIGDNAIFRQDKCQILRETIEKELQPILKRTQLNTLVF